MSFSTFPIATVNLSDLTPDEFPALADNPGFETTVTSAGTKTLTNVSGGVQELTGTTTHTVVLPVASTMTPGRSFAIINKSSGAVTVNSSGGNLVQSLAAGQSATIYLAVASGTDASSWDCIASSSGSSMGGVIGGSPTAGSVLFVGAAGILDQLNASFFYDNTNTQLQLTAGAATKTPLLVNGFASQSANLFEIRDSTAAKIFYVDPTGVIFGKGGASAPGFDMGAIAGGIGITLGGAAGQMMIETNVGLHGGPAMQFLLHTGTDTIHTLSDTGFGRFAAGVGQVTDGATGHTRFLLGGGGAVASATALPLPTGNVFHVTGTTNITSITATNLQSGVVITLIFDGVLTFTDGNNLKLASNFVTTADDTITLVYDGTNFYEVGRSVN